MSTIFFGSTELASFANYLIQGGVDRVTALDQTTNAAMINCAAFNVRYRENETPVTRNEIESELDSAPSSDGCGMLIYNCDGMLNEGQEAFFGQEFGQVITIDAPETSNTQEIVEKIRKSFSFTVDKFPLSGPDNMKTHHWGLFRSDTGDCVGNSCSSKYEPHNVDDLVALAEAGSAAFDGDCQVDCNWRNGHYLTISPSKEYRRQIYGKEDNIFPRLIISAGYDGKSFRGSLGLYRDLCQNLQMIRTAGEQVSASIKHTVGLRENIDDLKEQFATVAAKWSGVADTVKQMEAKQVDLAQFLADVYPESESDSSRTKNANRRRVQAILTRVLNEREKSGRPALTGSNWMVSAWEAFNGVQGYIQHDKNRKGKPSSFDRAIMAFQDSAVLKAEQMAIVG